MSNQLSHLTDLELQTIFAELDLDGNGFIGPTDLEILLASLGESVADDEIQEMISMCDDSGDGQVSLLEFTRMITSHMEKVLDIGICDKQEEKEVAMELGERTIALPSARVLSNADTLVPIHIVSEHKDEPIPTPISLEDVTESMTSTIDRPIKKKEAKNIERMEKQKSPTMVSLSSEGSSSVDSGTEEMLAHERAMIIRGFLDKLQFAKKNIGEVKAKWSALATINSPSEDPTHFQSSIDYAGFCRGMNEAESNPLCRSIFTLFDRDGSGQINFREFLVSAIQLLSSDPQNP